MRAVVLLCLLHAVSAQYDNPWDGPGKGGPVDNSEDNACTTDQGSCGCCLMLQEVYRLKSYFNNTLSRVESEYSQAMQILRNLNESRTAFSVTLFSDNRFMCYGPFLQQTTIIYQHVFLNLGNSYNVSTGIFTVPRSGVYTLVVTVYSDAGSANNVLAACANLEVNGQLIAASTETNSDDQEDSITTSVILSLTAGDRVYVSLPVSCYLCSDGPYNTFSGFLLYPTE